jgi:hypothetical protein
MDLVQLETQINELQKKNIVLLKKLGRFWVWLLVNGVIFTISAIAILQVYASLGFEKTLIIVLLLIVLSNVRQQFEKV